MTTTEAPTLPEVAADDLSVLADRLHEVFAGMSGSDLLITGGAGFLGYYLVQAPLAWNRANPSADPITVIVPDTRFQQKVARYRSVVNANETTSRTGL